MANDCKTRFSVRLPNGVVILGTYNHNTGLLEIGPDIRGEHKVEPRVWDEAGSICEDLEGNYFYLSEVKNALREVGVVSALELDF